MLGARFSARASTTDSATGRGLILLRPCIGSLKSRVRIV
jgi:hypothetical protein